MLPSLVNMHLHFTIMCTKLSQILVFKTVFLFYGLSLRPYVSVNGSVWPQAEAMRSEGVNRTSVMFIVGVGAL